MVTSSLIKPGADTAILDAVAADVCCLRRERMAFTALSSLKARCAFGFCCAWLLRAWRIGYDQFSLPAVFSPTFIESLLRARDKTAILRAVPLIIVFALNTQADYVTGLHRPLLKGLEVKPGWTDCNSSTAIVLPTVRPWVGASALHRAPEFVELVMRSLPVTTVGTVQLALANGALNPFHPQSLEQGAYQKVVLRVLQAWPAKRAIEGRKTI
jgi:hypothetical protein